MPQSLDLPHHELTEAESGRIDATRGFLCVYVLFFHWYSTYIEVQKIDWPWADRMFNHGYVAVQVFFVLSGFLISHSFSKMESQGRPKLWLRFFIKRVFRLYPAWLVALILYAVYRQTFGVGEFLWNFFFLFGLQPFRFQDVIAIHSWSIYVEATFYLAFPLILIFIRQGWILLGLILFSILSAIYGGLSPVPEGYLFYPPVKTFGYFIGGMLAYWFWPALRQVKMNQSVLVMALLSLIAVSLWTSNKWALIPAYSAFCFLLIAKNFRPITPIFEFFFRYVGKLCYSFYLIHLFWVWNSGRFGHWLFPNDSTLAILSILVISLVFSFCSAWLLYVFVERPGIHLGRKICSWVEADKKQEMDKV